MDPSDSVPLDEEVVTSSAQPLLTRSSAWGTWIDCDGFMPPPFGGPQPSYIANTYDQDVWYGRTINPATGYRQSINFNNIPVTFRWYAKWYLWSLEYIPVGGKRTGIKAFNSARGVFNQLGHFLRFVHAAGYNRLDAVPSKIILAASQDYILHPEKGCAELPLNDDGVTRKNRRSSKKRPKTKNEITVGQYLGIIDRSYFFGPGGCGYIPDGLLSDAADASVDIMAEAAETQGTKEIPEEVAHALLNTAIVWIEAHASVICRLHDAMRALKTSWGEYRTRFRRAKWESFVRHRLARRPEFQNDLREAFGLIRNPEAFFVGTKRPDVYLCWYQQYLETGDVSRFETASTVVTRFVNLLAAACYVVIAGFTGFRANEILGLKEGWVERKGGRAFIKTEIIKSNEVGGYQTDRPAPLICCAANDVLRTLSAAYRDRHDGRLFVTASGAVLDSKNLNWTIQEFAETTGVPKFDFASHQFRRFFALFYIRRFKGNLDALRRHFRHVSRSMIFAYMGDAGNAKYLIKEEQNLAREIAHSLVTGDGKYGSRHVGQREMKAMAKYKAQNLPPAEIEKRIQALIKRNYVQVTANEWGYCLPQKHDFTGSACGSKDGLPNHANAAPETCGTCRFVAVGHEHREWWDHTILVHQEILGHELSLLRLKEASQKMIETAHRVLAMLEPDVPDKEALAHG